MLCNVVVCAGTSQSEYSTARRESGAAGGSRPTRRVAGTSFLERCIGGFNQRQGEALPPQIFLTMKFVVFIAALKIIEIVAT